MADLEHVNIPDVSRHEPKGASTATAGQVFIADGEGSGAFGTSPGSAANVVTVESSADFPTAVAGVITLEDNTTYRIVGAVSIGSDRIVAGDNCGLIGINRFTDSITSTTTGTMLTLNQSYNFQELFFSCTAGTLLSSTATDAQTSLVTNCFAACTNIGTISSANDGWSTVFRSFSFISVSGTGLVFTGAHRAFNMTNSLWTGFVSPNTMLDLGTATFDRVQIVGGNRFNVDTGETGVSIAASSANINTGGRGFFSDSIFEGAGTYFSNYDPADLLWRVNTVGVSSSERSVDIYMQGNATGTSATTTPVLVAGTWSENGAQQFTCTAAGRCTYDGIDRVGFDCHVGIHCSATSGSSQTYFFYVYVNGVQEVASRAKIELTTSTPGNIPLFAHVELNNGDYVEVFVEKETGSDTITVDDIHFIMTAVN